MKELNYKVYSIIRADGYIKGIKKVKRSYVMKKNS